jgi:hypothetical protein
MDTRIQTICAWSILPFLGIYIFSFGWVAGFLPPQSPLMTGAQLVQFYSQNRKQIEIGQMLGLLSSGLMMVWPAAVSAQMARIEDRPFPLLAIIQYVAASVLFTLFMLCGIIWSVAAFRPDIAPDLLRLMNDTGWLIFVMGYPEYAAQLGAIALVGLSDRRPVPYLPRWACYATLGTAVDGSGGVFSALSPKGLFAWDGLLGFWLPVASFFVWLVFIILPFTLRAIRREALQGGDTDRHLAYQMSTINR